MPLLIEISVLSSHFKVELLPIEVITVEFLEGSDQGFLLSHVRLQMLEMNVRVELVKAIQVVGRPLVRCLDHLQKALLLALSTLVQLGDPVAKALYHTT